MGRFILATCPCPFHPSFPSLADDHGPSSTTDPPLVIYCQYYCAISPMLPNHVRCTASQIFKANSPRRTINHASAASCFWHTPGSSGIGKWLWYKGCWGRSGREGWKVLFLLTGSITYLSSETPPSMANYKIHPSRANEIEMWLNINDLRKKKS